MLEARQADQLEGPRARCWWLALVAVKHERQGDVVDDGAPEQCVGALEIEPMREPRRGRSAGPTARGSPRTDPDVGAMRRPSSARSVDLPLPDGPTTATVSPSSSRTQTSSRTSGPPSASGARGTGQRGPHHPRAAAGLATRPSPSATPVTRTWPDVADDAVTRSDINSNDCSASGDAYVAKFLSKHKAVEWVNYAGLPGNKYNALAKKICPKGAGSVFTFGLKGGYEAGVKLVSSVKLFSHLANIGDVRSLIIHPASTTHRQLTDEQRKAAGAGPDVVRLSIGIEDADDIIADLKQGLAG